MRTAFLFILTIVLIATGCKKSESEVLIIDPCGIDFQTTLHMAVIGSDFIRGPQSAPDSTLGFFIEKPLANVNINLEERYEIFASVPSNGSMIMAYEAEIPECINLVVIAPGIQEVLNEAGSSTYRNGFRALLQLGLNSVGSQRVFTSLIPDFSGAPFFSDDERADVSARIDLFNSIILQESEDLGISVADVDGPSSIYSGGIGHDPMNEGGNDLYPSDVLLRTWGESLALRIAVQVN